MIALAATRHVSAASIAGDWRLHPLAVAVAVVAVAAFWRAFLRVRRERPAEAAPARAVLFTAGLGLVVLPMVSPLNVAGDRYLLSAHMLEHVLLADAGPALMVLAVRGRLAAELVPGRVSLPGPIASLAAWAAVIGAWHVPAAYDAALTRPLLHAVEHLSFVAVGTLVWIHLIDPAGRGRLGVPGRLVFAVAIFFTGQVLSDILVFSFHPYYPAYADRPGRLLGISPLTDQRLAGLVMSLEQLATLGTCIVLLLRQLRRSRVGAGLLTTGDQGP